MTTDTVRIIGLVGSLRKGSYNRMAMNVAATMVPEGATLTVVEFADLPVYNGDVEAAGIPESVQKFWAALAEGDAFLIATPEYNYSIPGGLKNAIDWASRARPDALENKAVGIMGASMGFLGTARAQYHLRQALVFLNAFPVNRPEVMIGTAQNKFDENGNLNDETAKGLIRKLLEALVAHAVRLRE